MARKLKMDFTGVESFIRCEEGEHIAVLKEVEETTTQNGDDMLSCKFLVTKGTSTGAIVFENFVLTQKALWKFKSYLEVIGIKADGKIVIDIDKLVGKACIIKVVLEEYKGQSRAKIDSYKKLASKATAEEVDDEDIDEDEEEIEEEPPKKAKKSKPVEKKKVEEKKKAKKKPEPEEDEDFDEEDDDEWDEE